MSLRRDVAAFIQEYMMYIPPSGRYGGRGYSTKKELHEGTLVRFFWEIFIQDFPQHATLGPTSPSIQWFNKHLYDIVRAVFPGAELRPGHRRATRPGRKQGVRPPPNFQQCSFLLTSVYFFTQFVSVGGQNQLMLYLVFKDRRGYIKHPLYQTKFQDTDLLPFVCYRVLRLRPVACMC